MPRHTTIAAVLTIAALLAGCSRPAAQPAAPARSTPQTQTSPTTAAPGKSPVFSEISLMEHPWITAPASVTVHSGPVLFRFSGPVDRASVEKLLSPQLTNFPHNIDWRSDQEMVLSLNLGCHHFSFAMGGARDAQGRELDPANNPALNLHLPCHGGGQAAAVFPGGKPLAGFPSTGTILDTHSGTGTVLGRNGTVYFLVQDGTLRRLTNTAQSAWARFLPDGTVLLADGASLRLVAPDGTDVRRLPLPAEVLTGVLSPDKSEAVLLLATGETESAGSVLVDLKAWTVTKPATVKKPAAYTTLNWIPHTGQVRVVPQRGAPWILHVATGKTESASGGTIYSPDGRWVVDPDRGGIFPADQPNAKAVVSLTNAMKADTHPYALWAPDSRHVILPGGQILDIETGAEVGSIKSVQKCPVAYPSLLGKIGETLLAVYVDNCH